MNLAMAKRSDLNSPYCGDDYACWEHGGKTILCVVDGLGHGEPAEVAAKAAVLYVGNHLSEPLAQIFAGCNDEIRHTRGVAMGVAVIDENEATLTYGGIGNTVAKIRGSELKTLRSDPGIVGAGYRNLMIHLTRLSPGQILVMHTDGIPGCMDFPSYSAALEEDLNRLAAAIIEDWGRAADDSAVLIYRYGGPQC